MIINVMTHKISKQSSRGQVVRCFKTNLNHKGSESENDTGYENSTNVNLLFLRRIYHFAYVICLNIVYM